MATRILAQVLIAGATVVFRAATQAWGKALQSETLKALALS
jgi:import inner membrane translocase subunit TIM16